jgi:hypothetical protein
MHMYRVSVTAVNEPGKGGALVYINDIHISGSAVFNRGCSLTGMIDIRHQSARQ